MCPSSGLVLERRGQQTCQPFIHLLGEDWIGMHWQLDILPIAPKMVGQTYGHGWGAWCAPLAEILRRPHKVGEADHEPDLPPVARMVPGQTPGRRRRGGDQPTPCAIPAFHTGRLERRAELALAPLLAKTAWATEDHAPADLHDRASRVADLHHLGIKQGLRRHAAGLRLAAHFPPPLATLYHPQHLEQRGGIGLPPIRKKERDHSGARHNLCAGSSPSGR